MLSAMAARALRRPVKTVLTRQQMFHFTTHRSDTVQRVRLGAASDGKLTAIGHDAWSNCDRFDNFVENSAIQTRSLYAAPNRLTTHRSVKLDLPITDSTRAPGEAVGMLALEQAMDELAEKLNLDLIELRLRNEPTQHPELNIPHSTRQLVACMREGARRMLGVFAAGRILNEKTARSQAMGGMIWGVGVGAALHEDTVVDKRFGEFVNHDLAEYHVPAHADIPAIEVVFLPEVDDKANPLKIKGVGELGICGAGAAVANAIYNACGVRVRDYPLTLDKVLAGLEKRVAA